MQSIESPRKSQSTEPATMTTILQINSSLHGEGAQSSRLASEFVAALRGSPERKGATPVAGSRVIVRDLSSAPTPHLTAERLTALSTAAAERTLDQQRIVTESDELIDELKRADVVVIGLPMYNFGLPSAFKAWIDHISRGRRTFRYTAKGPEGLLRNIEHCWVIAARGGQYHGTPLDTQTPYLATMLGFLGIAAPTFIYAEGMARPDLRDDSLASARHTIEQLALG